MAKKLKEFDDRWAEFNEFFNQDECEEREEIEDLIETIYSLDIEQFLNRYYAYKRKTKKKTLH